MDRLRSRTRMPVYRKPMATPRFADRRHSHQLSPAASRVRAAQSGAFPDEKVKQVSFPAFVDDRLSSLVRPPEDRKSTRLNSSHGSISYAVFCLKKKTPQDEIGHL